MSDQRMKILMDILAMETVNDNEEMVAEYLQQQLKTVGIDSKKVSYSPTRTNLVAEIGQGDRVLAVSGHMDVVSAGDEKNWISPPFSPTIRDNKIFARGAADMKSGLAAMVCAMMELKSEKAELDGRLKLLATVGEEIGLYGSKQLTDEGYANYHLWTRE